MPVLDIRPFDPEAASAAEWRDFHVYRRLRSAEDDPAEPIAEDAEFEHDARHRWPLYEHRRLLVRRDGAIVGSIGFGFRRTRTPDYAAFAPFVHVWGGILGPWRRRGIGSALLHPLLAFMDERGKTTATAGTHHPEAHAFLATIGAVEKHRSVENRLVLRGLAWPGLARWEAGGDRPELRWELHTGRVPMARLAELQPAMTTLLHDVPLGDLDHPPLRMELDGIRSWYEEMDRHGGEHLLVLLLHGSTLAGVCEASWDARFPDRVHQALTGVSRDWRGQGLAKALKARMLRLIGERHPDVALMITSNAEVNAAMLSINQRLGFTVHRRDSSYQICRDALERWLASRPA